MRLRESGCHIIEPRLPGCYIYIYIFRQARTRNVCAHLSDDRLAKAPQLTLPSSSSSFRAPVASSSTRSTHEVSLPIDLLAAKRFRNFARNWSDEEERETFAGNPSVLSSATADIRGIFRGSLVERESRALESHFRQCCFRLSADRISERYVRRYKWTDTRRETIGTEEKVPRNLNYL